MKQASQAKLSLMHLTLYLAHVLDPKTFPQLFLYCSQTSQSLPFAQLLRHHVIHQLEWRKVYHQSLPFITL
uniref:Uncharacterized protein n=1 Tax=Arundo donax TaxID=35708 RepID=A0A0A9C6H1_ARUDO